MAKTTVEAKKFELPTDKRLTMPKFEGGEQDVLHFFAVNLANGEFLSNDEIRDQQIGLIIDYERVDTSDDYTIAMEQMLILFSLFPQAYFYQIHKNGHVKFPAKTRPHFKTGKPALANPLKVVLPMVKKMVKYPNTSTEVYNNSQSFMQKMMTIIFYQLGKDGDKTLQNVYVKGGPGEAIEILKEKVKSEKDAKNASTK